MKPSLKLLFLPLAATLSGCMSLTPSAIVEMAGFSPLTMDPKHLAIAVAMPEDLSVAPGGAAIRIAYKMPDREEYWVRDTYIFDIKSNEVIEGSPAPKPGERVQVARLTPQDAERLARAQEQITRLKQSGADGKGSFSIGVNKICHKGAKPEKIPQRVYMKTREGGSFVQMTSAVDILSVMKEDDQEKFLGVLSPCDTTVGNNEFVD